MLADTHGIRPSPLVLLVQENDDARQTLRRALECDGMFVVEARVGPEALATLRKTPPDVIAIDMTAGINGLGVCQRLRQQSVAERVPIIAFAEAFSPGEWATGVSCDVVLDKPCRPETLIAEIRRLLPPTC